MVFDILGNIGIWYVFNVFNSELDIVGVMIKLLFILIVVDNIFLFIIVFVFIMSEGIFDLMVLSVLSEVFVLSIIFIRFKFVFDIVFVIFIFCLGEFVWIIGNRVWFDISLEKCVIKWFFYLLNVNRF